MNALLSLLTRRAAFTDGEIDLCLSDEDVRDVKCGISDGYLFYLYRHRTRKYVGYVSLRLGESPSLYYLGHIGYRIEQEYRGHGYAGRACRLMLPLMRQHGLRSVVITTDVDNLPSRKTCEALGCTLERIAPVPTEYRALCSGSRQKCRYIWRLTERSGEQ